MVALTQTLVETYKRINDAYYSAKKQEHKNRKHEAAQRRQSTSQAKPDTAGHCRQVITGEVWDARYLVQGPIGKGTFGTVIAAIDIWTGDDVAIKVLRNRSAYKRQGLVEMQMLAELSASAPGTTFDLLGKFEQDGHMCLVFERAHMSLYELLQKSMFRGVTLSIISVSHVFFLFLSSSSFPFLVPNRCAIQHLLSQQTSF